MYLLADVELVSLCKFYLFGTGVSVLSVHTLCIIHTRVYSLGVSLTGLTVSLGGVRLFIYVFVAHRKVNGFESGIKSCDVKSICL